MWKQLAVMIIISVFLTGCNAIRFAPGETQKQNAWLHSRTAQVAADVAEREDTSQQLKALTSLTAAQSRAFTSYYGMPKVPPPANTVEQILAQSNWQLAESALFESTQRPDAWQIADGAIDLAIAVAALFGGVYGVRVASFLKQARNKSKALREIITGNELFKQKNPEFSDNFKSAHRNQSSQTRQIVAQTK